MCTLKNYKLLNVQVVSFLQQLFIFYNFEHIIHQYELRNKHDSNINKMYQVILKNIIFLHHFQVKFESLDEKKLTKEQKEILNTSFEKIFSQATILLDLISIVINPEERNKYKKYALISRLNKALCKYRNILNSCLYCKFDYLFRK